MAQAIIGGLRKRGQAGADIAVVEPLVSTRERLAREFQVHAVAAPQQAPRGNDVAVMAVKPQQMREAAAGVAAGLTGELVLSIAAGIRLADLSRWLGGHKLLARCMPNTPALIGQGASGLYCMPGVPEAQRRNAVQILEAVGTVLEVKDEAQLDPVTAVSGSGPAYVFLFIEALELAARELGFSAADAHALALQTFAGAASLAQASREDIATLRERVTSKGGTTERALASMRADGVVQAIVRAVHAANERATQLGTELGKD